MSGILPVARALTFSLRVLDLRSVPSSVNSEPIRGASGSSHWQIRGDTRERTASAGPHHSRDVRIGYREYCTMSDRESKIVRLTAGRDDIPSRLLCMLGSNETSCFVERLIWLSRIQLWHVRQHIFVARSKYQNCEKFVQKYETKTLEN